MNADGTARAASAAEGVGLEHQPVANASPSPQRQDTRLQRDDPERFFDELIATARAEAKLPVAGLVVSLVRDGQVVLTKGYGYTGSGQTLDVDPAQTLFRIGSTSKVFTTTAVMQLVERKKLDLHADVNTYLPEELQLPSTFEQPVTLKNLLTHTGGFEENQIGYMVVKDPTQVLPLKDALARDMPARVRPPTTDFTKGGEASYSSWAIALAGYIVERKSGQPFNDYMDEHVFAPLGMTRSTFHEPLPGKWNAGPDAGKGWVFKDGRFVVADFEYFGNVAPAGGLTTTAADMTRFMLAQLRHGEVDGKRILEADTVRRMHTRVFSPHPNVNGSCYGFYEQYMNGRRMIGHGGVTVRFRSEMVLLPEEGVGLFLSFCSQPPPTLPRQIVKGFMDRYFPAELPALSPKAAGAGARRYAGSYFPVPHSHTRFEKALLLAHPQMYEVTVKPTPDHRFHITNLFGMPPGTWVEAAPGVLRQTDGEEMIAFLEDRPGRVSHVVGPMPAAPSYKLDWYQTPDFHHKLLTVTAAIFALTIIAALPRDVLALGNAWPRWLAGTLAAINLTALWALRKAFADIPRLVLGYPPIGRTASSALALLSVPLTLGLLVLAGRAWWLGHWSLYGRVEFSVIAAAAAAFLWSMRYWNLIGLRIR